MQFGSGHKRVSFGNTVCKMSLDVSLHQCLMELLFKFHPLLCSVAGGVSVVAMCVICPLWSPGLHGDLNTDKGYTL